MTTEKQLQWAKTQLSTIMTGDQKTRYKTILLNESLLLSLEESLVLVANQKLHAYNKAFTLDAQNSFNWINQNPSLAKATLVLHQNNIAISDIPMMPQEVLSS